MDSIKTVESSLSVDAATEAVKEAAVANGFGVIGFHHINETMAAKGVDCPMEVRIVEVCSPKVAARMLGMSPDVSSAMPCRISVFDRDGQTTLGCISTHALLGLYSIPEEGQSQAKALADEVQGVLDAIMDAARG